MNTAELPGYSATAVSHFRHPRNVGKLPDADAMGAVEDPTTENFISIYLRIETGRVSRAGFRTLGCSACVAASSAVTELATGKRLDAIAGIDADAVLDALDGLPPAKRHCAELAARAVREAVASYASQSRSLPE